MEVTDYANSFKFADIACFWNQGRVTCSWLLEPAKNAFHKDEKLADIKGYEK